jgi:hypothetical protein
MRKSMPAAALDAAEVRLAASAPPAPAAALACRSMGQLLCRATGLLAVRREPAMLPGEASRLVFPHNL